MLHCHNSRVALSWVIQDIHRRGWATGTGGNFSLVITREPICLLMAPSGVDKGMLAAGDLLEVDGQGKVIDGIGKASAETPLHLAMIKATGAAAVLHTHSIFGTLLSMIYSHQQELVITGFEMLKGLEGITSHTAAIRIPVLQNSQDMTQLSQEVLATILKQTPHPHGLLLVGHGFYTWGYSLFQARRHLEILEFLFELLYRKLAIHSSCLDPCP